MRRINVFWWRGNQRELIGTLAEAARAPIMFEWDKSFLSNAVELSPIKFKKGSNLIECPQEPFGGLPGLFADSVPDGWGRLLIKAGLAKAGLVASDLSPLDALAFIGENGMGALSFEPAMKSRSVWAGGKILLSALERGIPSIVSGTPSAVIDTFLENGASPNGMRPKIILREKDGKFFPSTSGGDGDEWIIKFKSEEDPRDVGKLEYIYSNLARTAGLVVPDSRLFSCNGRHFYGTRRFDRVGDKRIHVHTLSGILHAAPGDFSIGYDHFAKVAQLLTQDIREVEKVFRLAVFNVFAVNQDDHSRNVAFILNLDGSWQVAPAYDLTFFRTSYSEHKMPINGKGTPTERELIDFGVNLGISKKRILTIIDCVKDALSGFLTLSKDFDLSRDLEKSVLAALDKSRSGGR